MFFFMHNFVLYQAPFGGKNSDAQKRSKKKKKFFFDLSFIFDVSFILVLISCCCEFCSREEQDFQLYKVIRKKYVSKVAFLITENKEHSSHKCHYKIGKDRIFSRTVKLIALVLISLPVSNSSRNQRTCQFFFTSFLVFCSNALIQVFR